MHPPDPTSVEGQVKALIASGEDPSESLLIQWGRCSEESSLSLKCLTLVLTYLQAGEAWDVLKEAALEELADTPSEAFSVLVQAVQLAGWPKVRFQRFSINGDECVSATLELDRRYEAKVTYPSRGNRTHAQYVAAYEILKGITEGRLFSSRRIKNADKLLVGNTRKSPISRFYEYCQARGIASPVFDYEVLGDRFSPKVACRTSFQSAVFEGWAKSKQEAKIAVCVQVLKSLGILQG